MSATASSTRPSPTGEPARNHRWAGRLHAVANRSEAVFSECERAGLGGSAEAAAGAPPRPARRAGARLDQRRPLLRHRAGRLRAALRPAPGRGAPRPRPPRTGAAGTPEPVAARATDLLRGDGAASGEHAPDPAQPGRHRGAAWPGRLLL